MIIIRCERRLQFCGFFHSQDGTKGNEEVDGRGRCPYDPLHNSTSIYAGGQLYSGTVADFSGGDPLIYKEPMRTERLDFKQLNGIFYYCSATFTARRVRGDGQRLIFGVFPFFFFFFPCKDPNFVSSLEYKDYIFFFFREIAVEYINCGKVSIIWQQHRQHISGLGSVSAPVDGRFWLVRSNLPPNLCGDRAIARFRYARPSTRVDEIIKSIEKSVSPSAHLGRKSTAGLAEKKKETKTAKTKRSRANVVFEPNNVGYNATR